MIVAQLVPAAPIPPGSVSHYPARHVDLVPTLLDAVGLSAPPALPGHSLLPGAPQVRDADVSSYFEAMSAMLNRGWAPLQGVVAGHEKYIDLPKPELYDLETDPKEQSNLVDRLADRRRVLEARLQDFHAAPPGERFAEAPEVAAKLQSLGYTSGSAPRKAKYTEEDDPKNLMELDQWIQQGIEAWQHGRRGEALQTYERIIQRRPSMAIGYRNLAFLQWQNGDARGAIQTLERAFHADAIEPGMTTQLGSYLAEAGRPTDAIALLEPLASQKPADPDALNALGIAYARAGQGGSIVGGLPPRARREPVERPGAGEHRHARDAARQSAGREAGARAGGRARSPVGPRPQRPRRRRDAHREPPTRRSRTGSAPSSSRRTTSTRSSTSAWSSMPPDATTRRGPSSIASSGKRRKRSTRPTSSR